MAKKRFDDPLEEIDPIMEEAFSFGHDAPGSSAPHQEERASKRTTYDDDESRHENPTVSEIQFPNLSKDDAGKKFESDIFNAIPVNLSVELGRSQITLKEVYELMEGSIIELERLVGEPLDLVVNGQIIAQGEVVAIDNNYGLRVTNIIASTKG